jgi:hypothetical protein
MGRLEILNVAVAERSGSATLWIRDDCSIWNSLDPRIAGRNGGRPRAVSVRAIKFGEILDTFGIPFYLKIDIERSDHLCVRALVGRVPPPYISAESECVGDGENLDSRQCLGMLNALHTAGYRRFKLVSQEDFSAATASRVISLVRRGIRSAAHGRLRFPVTAWLAKALTPECRLGRRHGYAFPYGSSGPWGDGMPGCWLSFEEAAALYLAVRDRHFRTPGMAKYSFWYDWHATY